MHKWELESGRRWDDGTKVAIVARWAPQECRQLLQTAPSSVTSSFASLKEAIENYDHRGEIYSAMGVATAVDRMPRPIEIGSTEKGRWLPRALRRAAVEQRGNQYSQRQQQWNRWNASVGAGRGGRGDNWGWSGSAASQSSTAGKGQSQGKQGGGGKPGQPLGSNSTGYAKTSQSTKGGKQQPDKGKGKGKSKSKNKGKGKGTANVNFFRCGQSGHFASQCQTAQIGRAHV